VANGITYNGHEVDVTDSNPLTSHNPNDPVNYELKYNLVRGTGNELYVAWLHTFSRLHPRKRNRKLIRIEVKNPKGRTFFCGCGAAVLGIEADVDLTTPEVERRRRVSDWPPMLAWISIKLARDDTA